MRIGSIALRARLFLGLSVWLVLVSHVSAQESAVKYIEYPQILGKVQPLNLSSVPKWATFDGSYADERRTRRQPIMSRATNSYMK